MSVGQEAGQDPVDDLLIADDDLPNLFLDAAEALLKRLRVPLHSRNALVFQPSLQYNTYLMNCIEQRFNGTSASNSWWSAVNREALNSVAKATQKQSAREIL